MRELLNQTWPKCTSRHFLMFCFCTTHVVQIKNGNFALLCQSTMKRNDYGHHSIHNPDQNDSISRSSYSQIPMCKPHPSVHRVSVSHNITMTDNEKETAGAAQRQAPTEQTKVDGLLSPQSRFSNI